MRLPRSPLTPLVSALLVVVLVAFATQIRQIAAPSAAAYRPPNSVPRMPVVQADFRILLGANHAYIAGARDYAETQRLAQDRDFQKRIYGYGPFVYRLFASLNLLGEAGARRVWLFAFPLAFLLSLLAFQLTACGSLRTRWPEAFLFAAACFVASASTLLQMERGNFDWVVLTLYLFSLALIAGERRWLAGLPLGMAIALKVYPAVFLPFLLVLRRWREAASAVATLLAIVLVTGPASNMQWLASLLSERMHVRALHPWNTSLANAFSALDSSIAPATANRLGQTVFLALTAAMIGLVAYLRHRGLAISPAQLGALVLPLMFMIPALTWGYTLFSLIAVLLVLADDYARPASPRRLLLVIAVVIGLCQSALPALRVPRPYARWTAPILSLSLVALTILFGWALTRGLCQLQTQPSASGSAPSDDVQR